MVTIKKYNRLFLILILLEGVLMFAGLKELRNWSLDMILLYVIAGIIGLLMIKTDGLNPLEILPFNVGLKLKTIFLVIALTIVIQPVSAILSYIGATYFGNMLEFVEKYGDLMRPTGIESIFCTAVVPAIFEELYFRGFFYTPYKKAKSIRVAIFLSAFLFGIFHMNVQQFLYAFAFGIVIAIIRELTGSMWAGVLFHFVNNGLATVGMYLPDNIKNADIFWLGCYFNSTKNTIISIITVVISIILTYFTLKLIAKTEGKDEEFRTFFKEEKNNNKIVTPSLVIGIIICFIVMIVFTLLLAFIGDNINKYIPNNA